VLYKQLEVIGGGSLFWDTSAETRIYKKVSGKVWGYHVWQV